MNPFEQTNGIKSSIVCLLQRVESLKDPVDILSWCYYIIPFSFWQAIILVDFWSIAPFLRIGSFPLLWNMISTLPIIAPSNDRQASQAYCNGNSGEGEEGPHRNVVWALGLQRD